MQLTKICAVVAAGLIGSAVLAETGQAGVPESKDPIKIILNNWTSQVVLANVTGELLKKMGYNVELVPSDNQLQYAGMANGDVHMQIEVWEGTHKTNFLKYVATGNLLDAGTHLAITREEWWYPKYMEERCPGLPDWKALDKCAGEFATPETAPKGRYLGGPIDWGKHHNERVQALGMNFVVVNAGQASTLWAELDAAYRRNEPIVLFNWTPNWVEAKYEGRFVDFPDYAPECLSEPGWGMNPDLAYDCGAPRQGWLKKGAWAGAKDKWPTAWRLLTLINFTNPMIAQASAFVDVDEMTAEEAASNWLEQNEAVWKPWIEAVMPQ
ncbi:MAG: ABC transporter substrate-binding protein [Alphaproteobacteria bacterium]